MNSHSLNGDPASTGPCSLGPCSACGRGLRDNHPDHVGHVGLGPEFICGGCHTWTNKVIHWFLVKTRRMNIPERPVRPTFYAQAYSVERTWQRL